MLFHIKCAIREHSTFLLKKLMVFSALVLAVSAVSSQELYSQKISKDQQPHLTRLQAKLKKGFKPYDQPGEAQAFYAFKRAPTGETAIPVERYGKAIAHIQQMPLFDTGLNDYIFRADENQLKAGVLTAWEPLGPGNIGGRTRALVINPENPDIMYAGGVAGGVWKTINGGNSWVALDDLMANIAVGSLAMDPADPNVLYAGTGEGFFNGDSVRGAGIFKTMDGGETWSQIEDTNNSNFYYVNDVIVSPNNSNIIYAATRTGIWRSNNAGANWDVVLSSTITGGCLDLAIRTDQINDYVFASCGSFVQSIIYRNINAGGNGSWDPVKTEAGMGRVALAIAPSNQDVIYALSASIEENGNYSNGGLYKLFRSTDSGNNWSTRVANTSDVKLNTLLLTNPVIATLVECNYDSANSYFNQGWYDNTIAVDPIDSDIVWVGGIDLFRSNDGGKNWGIASYWWLDPNFPEYNHADHHTIVFHPNYNGTSNTTMFTGNDGGVHRTTNARAEVATGSNATCSNSGTNVHWKALNNNYGVTQFYHGVSYPGGMQYFGGTQDNGTLRGTDATGSEEWIEILGGDGGYVAVDPSNTQVLYAENTRLSIQKSTDGGVNFSPATNGISESSNNFLFINNFAMDPNNSSYLWTGGWYLWRTTDATKNWVQASAITTGVGSVSAIAIAPSNANYVLAGMSDGYIHRTSVGMSSGSETNWAYTQPTQGYVSSLSFDPNNHNIAYATYSTFGVKHVWRSIDAGASWVSLDGSTSGMLPDIPVHSIVVDPENSANLYIGTDLGVFVSKDTGASWAQENTGFANVVTESLSINRVNDKNYLFAFTHGRGAWRVALPNDSSPCTDNLNLTNKIVTGVEYFVGCTSISVGPNFRVESNGNVFFTGGTVINFRNGFSIAKGGRLQAKLISY